MNALLELDALTDAGFVCIHVLAAERGGGLAAVHRGIVGEQLSDLPVEFLELLPASVLRVISFQPPPLVSESTIH